jgi:alpha-N-acetylglucosaminidase
MQAWLAVNSPGFWTPTVMEAFLSGVPDEHMLLLDLYSESETVAWR